MRRRRYMSADFGIFNRSYHEEVLVVCLADGYRCAGVGFLDGRSALLDYRELLEVIESRAPNLTPRQLPSDLWLYSSVRAWRQLFVFLILFVVYIIIRKILGW